MHDLSGYPVVSGRKGTRVLDLHRETLENFVVSLEPALRKPNGRRTGCRNVCTRPGRGHRNYIVSVIPCSGYRYTAIRGGPITVAGFF